VSRAFRAAAALLPAALLAGAMPARGAAQAEPSDLPPALQGVEVVERLGAQVPLSASFVDQDGRPVRLERWLGKDRPVVMALVYYECPMLCGLVLGGLARGMKETGLELGKDFRALAVSFDPREKPAQATVRQKAYLQALDRSEARDDWAFLVGAEPDIRAVTESVGFHYAYDPETKQYAHAAAIFVLTPEGKVSRYLYGVEFAGRDLRLALVEASQGRVGTSFDRFLLTCYRYDPAARRYVPYALGLVRAGAVAVLLGLAGGLAVLWRREAKGKGEAP
jgi:protein SCO1/2